LLKNRLGRKNERGGKKGKQPMTTNRKVRDVRGGRQRKRPHPDHRGINRGRGKARNKTTVQECMGLKKESTLTEVSGWKGPENHKKRRRKESGKRERKQSKGRESKGNLGNRRGGLQEEYKISHGTVLQPTIT